MGQNNNTRVVLLVQSIVGIWVLLFTQMAFAFDYEYTQMVEVAYIVSYIPIMLLSILIFFIFKNHSIRVGAFITILICLVYIVGFFKRLLI